MRLITVVPSRPQWARQFAAVSDDLTRALKGVNHTVEHVGSTAVPGLAAKPVLDIDVVVSAEDVAAAVEALEAVGYRHEGNLGIPGREALEAPDEDPPRHVYVCERDGLALRNHLGVRDVLRADPVLRERYGALKTHLASDPDIPMDQYVAAKSAILQQVLRTAGLGEADRDRIHAVNQAHAEQADQQPPGNGRAHQG